MTALAFVKAMAYFRGGREVSLADVRQLLPFVLHDKLQQDPDCPFFESPENAVFRTDKIGWIRKLFDLACAEYERLELDRDDPVAQLSADFERGLDGVGEREVKAALVRIERVLAQWGKSRKFYGHMFDDVLKLKYLHQRYTNYLRWLRWKGE
jgi:MoxR-like ATPase